MKLLYYVFPLFAAILLYACVKEINLDRKQFTPLPVVNCLFTPDSTWTVFVATTKLLNDPSTALISNATVSIYADNQLIENLILGQAGQYKGQVYNTSVHTTTLLPHGSYSLANWPPPAPSGGGTGAPTLYSAEATGTLWTTNPALSCIVNF